jgi:fatty acid-binding protein DegV
MGVVHVDAEPEAHRIRTALEERFRPNDIIVNPATAVIGAHAGADAWGVFWQVEDGIPPRHGNKAAAARI